MFTLRGLNLQNIVSKRKSERGGFFHFDMWNSKTQIPPFIQPNNIVEEMEPNMQAAIMRNTDSTKFWQKRPKNGICRGLPPSQRAVGVGFFWIRHVQNKGGYAPIKMVPTTGVPNGISKNRQLVFPTGSLAPPPCPTPMFFHCHQNRPRLAQRSPRVIGGHPKKHNFSATPCWHKNG